MCASVRKTAIILPKALRIRGDRFSLERMVADQHHPVLGGGSEHTEEEGWGEKLRRNEARLGMAVFGELAAEKGKGNKVGTHRRICRQDSGLSPSC